MCEVYWMVHSSIFICKNVCKDLNFSQSRMMGCIDLYYYYGILYRRASREHNNIQSVHNIIVVYFYFPNIILHSKYLNKYRSNRLNR